MPNDFRNWMNDWRSARRVAWTAAVNELAEGAPLRVWRERSEIEAALDAILGEGTVAYLPPGGTRTFICAGPSSEPNCMELWVDRGRAYVVRPRELTLLHVEARPIDSIWILRLDELMPCGLYRRDREDHRPDYDNEEVLEVDAGRYVHADLQEGSVRGHIGTGQPVTVPDDARRIVRWFRGNMVIMSCQSRLNRERNAIDGHIAELSDFDIRALLQSHLGSTGA